MHGKVILTAALGCCALLAGCERSPTRAALPTPVANAVRVETRRAPLTVELVGTVQSYQQADLRSRVTGLVTGRHFQGGQAVKAGDLLYTIDPAQYDEDLANAQASLSQARAAQAQSDGDVKRYSSLMQQRAIAPQAYDQAVSVAKQNAAVVAARLTTLRLAELNLSYTKIVSPISGQIDMPQVDVGTLVTAGQTSLGTVSTLSPVYVEFSLPEAAFVGYMMKNDMTRVTAAPPKMPPATLVLPDGTVYAQKGALEYASRTVDSTGSFVVRAVFQNPSQILRPGLNVRLRLTVGVIPDALLAPQRAVGDLLGQKFLYVVGKNDVIEQRMVKLGPTLGDMQVIESGLKPGEAVIADGLQFVKPGQPAKVKMVPLEAGSGG